MADIKFAMGVDPSGLTTGLARALASIKGATASMSSSLSGVRTSVAGVSTSINSLAASLGAGLSVAAFAGSMRTAINELADLDDAAEKTGNSVEDMSSLLNTLAPTGVSLDTLTAAMSRLTKSMIAGTEETKGAGEAFAVLGIKTRDAGGNLRPTAAVLDEVATALNQYRDGANKTAIAQALFGKSGAELLPMLKDLATRQREAATVTSDQAAAAETAANALRKLEREMTQMRQELASNLVPGLNDFISKLRSIAAISANPIKWAGVLFGSASDIDAKVKSTEAEIARLNKLVEDSAKGPAGKSVQDRPGGGGLLGALIERATGTPQEQLAARARLLELARDLQELKAVQAAQRQMNVTGVAQPQQPFSDARYRPKGEAPAVSGGASTAAAKKDTPLASFVDAETKALQELGRLFEQAAVTTAAEAQDLMTRLDAMFFSGQISAELYQGAIDKLFKTTQTAGKDGVGALSKQLEDQAERWKDTIEPSRQYIRQLEEIRRLVEAGNLTPQQGASAEFGVQNAMEDALNPSKGGQDATFSWLNSMESGFRRLFDGIKEGSLSTRGVMLGAFEMIYSGVSGSLAKLAGEWVVNALLGKVTAVQAAFSQISASAAAAGAGAFAATAGIPFIGPGLAPAAGAAAYAGAMSFASGLAVASARDGFDIPAGVNPLTQLHEKEMVLPAEIAEPMRDQLRGGRRGGGSELHFHSPDPRGMRRMFLDNTPDLARALRTMRRNGVMA